MRRNILIFVILSLILNACHNTKQPTGDVIDQGPSDNCWIIAMLGTIETEHYRQGDSVKLSTDYLCRQWLLQQAQRSYLSGGKTSVSIRGVAPAAITLLQQYGAMPESSYHARNAVNYNVLARKVRHLTRLAIKRRSGLASLTQQIERLMDEEIGYLPNTIYMYSDEYTPLEFAHSVCMPDEYTAYCSVTHHPFHQDVALELPDNTTQELFRNIPIDSLVQKVRTALHNNHPVLWEGDTSNGGFRFADAVADVPESLRNATQQQRQREIERFAVTDDHAMCLVGIETDKSGREWVIARNSWGTNNPMHGYMRMSIDYLRLNTTAVVINRTILK